MTDDRFGPAGSGPTDFGPLDVGRLDDPTPPMPTREALAWAMARGRHLRMRRQITAAVSTTGVIAAVVLAGFGITRGAQMGGRPDVAVPLDRASSTTTATTAAGRHTNPRATERLVTRPGVAAPLAADDPSPAMTPSPPVTASASTCPASTTSASAQPSMQTSTDSAQPVPTDSGSPTPSDSPSPANPCTAGSTSTSQSATATSTTTTDTASPTAGSGSASPGPSASGSATSASVGPTLARHAG